jgi:hypothetical protein
MPRAFGAPWLREGDDPPWTSAHLGEGGGACHPHEQWLDRRAVKPIGGLGGANLSAS